MKLPCHHCGRIHVDDLVDIFFLWQHGMWWNGLDTVYQFPEGTWDNPGLLHFYREFPPRKVLEVPDNDHIIVNAFGSPMG